MIKSKKRIAQQVLALLEDIYIGNLIEDLI